MEMGEFGNKIGAWFDRFMLFIILANVAAVAAETVDTIHEKYAAEFFYFEVFSVVFFSIEYLTRIWVSIENYRDQNISNSKVRLNYILSPMAIIDFISIIPFYLVALGAPDLRFLRIFRLLRLLKLVRYSHGLSTMGRVLYDERRSLTAALIIMMGATFFAATIMYFIEKDMQPDDFGSIPQSLWWAIATLTTVGYGDVVPHTGLGRLVGGMVMIFGLAFYAIPIGIVASAFTSEINRRDFVVRYGLVARVPLFEGLDPDTINDISSMLRAMVVEKGGVISHVGEEADGMYFLVSGDAAAVFDDKRVPIIPGSFFGEVSLLRKTFREITVVAQSTCKIMLLETHDFQHLLLMRPVLKERLESMVENRLGGLVEEGEITLSEKEAIQAEHKYWFSQLKTKP
jgi:voltage-gated potassium channel